MARRASAKPAQWQLPAALACLGLVAVLIFLSSAAHGHGLISSADSEHKIGLKRLGQSILKAQQSSSSQLVVFADKDGHAAVPTKKPPAAGDFRVQFDVVTEDGPGKFVVRVHEDWAPAGAARFRQLVEAKYYDDIRFFRVIPTFMVQFGISGDPALNSEWRAQPIKDDSVKQSNKPGYVTFAKTGAPNSRTTQVFINYFDNAGLDSQGFAPFGVVEGDGMSVVKKIYNCGEKPNQGRIQSEGNAYLDREFPRLSRVVAARVLPDLPKEEASASPSPAPALLPSGEQHRGDNVIEWILHEGKSCQGYANGDGQERPLEASKVKCLENEVCLAIECNHGNTRSCTLRGSNMAIDYAPADCYEMVERTPDGKILSTKVPDYYNKLLKEYPFQQVATQSGQQVNIILVRSHMSQHQRKLYEMHKDEILFIGISSMNDYPLSDDGVDWVGMFPGFLHMMRDPEKHFPPHVKYTLMSQSDFSLPNKPYRDYTKPKKYDFTYSASDCDVASDGKGWCGWSKNWSFVKESLKIMCNPPYNLKGVLVATKSKDGKKAYTLPPECKDKMIQTTFLPNQQEFFGYIENSRFVFLPQIHDASPRVSTQALAHDVPILMNYYIMGGWKYVNDQTGEFFHDISDFRQALDKILKGSDTPNHYNPKKWVTSHYGDEASGKELLKWIQENFADRVKLPKGTTRLQI